MGNPIPTDFGTSLPFLQTTDITGRSIQGCCVTDCVEMNFRDILTDEQLLSDVMRRLKEILPEDLYTQVEDMVESGNGLPLAAMFSPEVPLSNLDGTHLSQSIQEALGSNAGPLPLPSILASALKMGEENLQKQGGDPGGRTFQNLGRQISDALSAISDKAEGTDLGKQIQDLLVAAKAEVAASDPGLRAISTASVGSDGTVTPGNAIHSAITGLSMVQTASSQASSGVPAPPAITAPTGEEAWGQAMGDRIMWMMGKGIQAASIRINPPELGSIHVQLSVQNDQASVSILVQHGVVKDALEASIPRLREMLGDSNLNLVNVDVSHRESPDQSGSSAMYGHDHGGQTDPFFTEQEPGVAIEEELPKYYRSTGLLDDYA